MMLGMITHASMFTALGKQRQAELCEFKAIPVHIERLGLENSEQKFERPVEKTQQSRVLAVLEKDLRSRPESPTSGRSSLPLALPPRHPTLYSS